MDVSAASFKRSRGLFRRVKWYSRGSGAECIFLQNGDIFFKETSNMRLFSVINGFQICLCGWDYLTECRHDKLVSKCCLFYISKNCVSSFFCLQTDSLQVCRWTTSSFFKGFFFPIFSSLMLYDELQCYRYYPLYAMNDVAEQYKNVRELSRAFFSIAADNWSTDIFHQRARVNDNSSSDCDKKTSFHLP